MKRLLGVAALVSLVAAGMPTSPAGAAFPGRNGKILYVTWMGGLTYSTMNPDGSGKKEILGGRRIGFQAQFSPDGRSIVFEEYLNTPQGWGYLYQEHVFTMKADGSQVQSLSQPVMDEGGPSWGPRGDLIVFDRERPQVSTDIWVMNRDGSDARPLLERPNWDEAPRVSPDGKRVSFLSWLEEGTYPLPDHSWSSTLFVMNSDGTNVRQIVEVPPGAMVLYHDWSPDGRYVVFDMMKPPSYMSDLFVVRYDGKGLRRLTNTPNEHEDVPVWSPDGRKIMFESDVDGDADVYVMNLDGTGRKNLTNDTVDNWAYDWQARR